MDSREPLVSIIVPFFNVEKYIDKCLDSIASQTYRNIEIILVNDGTTENEEAIVEKYLRKDDRFRYIKKDTNEGLFKARVSGVKEASGDYIMFVDSDDYISVDYVRLLLQEAIKSDSDIVFSRTVTCTPKGSYSMYVAQDTELDKLPLLGDDLKHAFYGQHGLAYVWHTVWNKLYKRQLWDCCLPVYESLNEHIVMTEDIAFSTVLFYYTKKASRVMNAVYFYCQHAEASTNLKAMSYSEFERKYGDVCKVFSFVEKFFADKDVWLRNDVDCFKRLYARIWKRIAESLDAEDALKAVALCQDGMGGDTKEKSSLEDYYFTLMEIPYDNGLDELKKDIAYGGYEAISFDVFDTAIVRNVFQPTHLFWLLDKEYEKHESSNVSFYVIRTKGEAACREVNCSEEVEDVTLEDIYSYISATYGVSKDVAEKVKTFEENLEAEFSTARNALHEVYEVAKLFHKKIFFTSDMYLSKKCIERILNKCGYREYEDIIVSSEYKKLKRTGKLYDVLTEKAGVSPQKIMHLGDSAESDVKKAAEKGIRAVYIPRTIDMFCGATGRNARRINLGKQAAGEYCGSKGFENNVAYGVTIALSANKFFDNPFTAINDNTDFNINPCWAGYYLLGTNLIGQIEWVEQIAKTLDINRLVFTSRDGYLLKRAYDKYKSIVNKGLATNYFYVSRKSMMPWMINCKTDMMNLPIVIQKYSPRLIDELLDFCLRAVDEETWREFLNSKGINYDFEFARISDYHTYINLIWKQRYDAEKHETAKNVVSQYCSSLHSDDAVFDLGYSASIHKAIIDAAGVNSCALFIHADEDKHLTNARRGKFNIRCYNTSIPNISGLMREFFFSSTEGSCIGYKVDSDATVPVLEDEYKYYSDLEPLHLMQDRALEMVEDYYMALAQYVDYIEAKPDEMQLPFEEFLYNPSKVDTKMFAASWFEDKVYGRVERINVRDFWIQLLMLQNKQESFNMVSNTEDFLREHGKKKLAFFGTGKICDSILDYNPGISVSLFLDNSPQKDGTTYRGVPILNPYKCDDIKEYYIVIAIGAYKEIEEQLGDMELNKYDDYVNYLEIF